MIACPNIINLPNGIQPAVYTCFLVVGLAVLYRHRPKLIQINNELKLSLR